MLSLLDIALLNHERIACIKIIKESVILIFPQLRLKVVIAFVGDQPIIIVDLTIAWRRRLAGVHRFALNSSGGDRLDGFSLVDGAAELVRLVLQLVRHALLSLVAELALGAGYVRLLDELGGVFLELIAQVLEDLVEEIAHARRRECNACPETDEIAAIRSR